MKRIQQSVVLAGLLALGLAGCKSPMGYGSSADTSGAGSTSSGSSGAGSTSSGSSGTSGNMPMGPGTSIGAPDVSSGTSGGGYGSSGSRGTQQQGGGGSASTGANQGMPGQTSQGAAGSSMASSPNAVVTLIEVVPRQGGSAATGADSTAGSAVGGTGATGTTGSSMGANQVYRVTMLMDDGSTQVVTMEEAPTFRSGDRVNMSGGTITR